VRVIFMKEYSFDGRCFSQGSINYRFPAKCSIRTYPFSQLGNINQKAVSKFILSIIDF
jgi:hypothetical protein